MKTGYLLDATVIESPYKPKGSLFYADRGNTSAKNDNTLKKKGIKNRIMRKAAKT